MIVHTKTVYLSDDGVEFDTKEECFAWENRKVILNKVYKLIMSDYDFSAEDCGYFAEFVADNIMEFREILSLKDE